MILTEVWVPGHPRTKGSLTPKGGAVERSPRSARWQVLMGEQVRQDIARRERAEGLPPGLYPYRGPVAVWFAAWLPPTRSATPEELGGTMWHGAGDVDKLARNVLDALAADARNATMNGGAYLNDNQVRRLSGQKFTSKPGDGRPSGMLVQVATYDGAADDEAYWRGVAARVYTRQVVR